MAVCICFINTTNAQTAAAKKNVLVVKSEVDIKQGSVLISKADCSSCHKPTIKLIGPSFKQIATKYPPTKENYDFLILKVIKGGSGSWGPMAMSPHANLPVEDVKKMVAYILSVK